MLPLRDENPSHGVPFITIGLIVINTIVFIYEASIGMRAESFVMAYAIIPAEIFGSIPSSLLPLFSSMFLHGGLLHLLGNMWFLWIFGDNLEEYLGHVGYLFFYLITGIVAGLAHIFLNHSSNIPTLGASGAVSGVLGGYLVLFPRIRIRTLITLGFFFQVIRIPAIFFLGLWFIMQLLGGLGGEAQIAFGAHVGGFIAGVLFIVCCSTKQSSFVEHRYNPKRMRRW
ncbi:MAG: rhomboid family intramembrane serine protease [Deltaproteobacteria bacterium]|nr:rhomboid family intramembrane serine protease [Deltaproteobacteria bacterium]